MFLEIEICRKQVFRLQFMNIRVDFRLCNIQ